MSSNIRITRICQYCDTAFTAKTTVTKYCGDNCAKRAYKERKKKEKIESSHQETERVSNYKWHEVNERDFLNIRETCLLLGISRATLWRLTKEKLIKSKSIGTKRIFRRADIDDFMTQ
jgi:excisionase family DNA binding protein